MRAATILIVLGILTGLVIAMEPGKPTVGKLDVKDMELKEFAAQRAKLHQVTTKPHYVLDRSIMFCAAPSPDFFKKKPDNPHENYAVMVYLTDNGRDMMSSGKGIYPVGTVILKEKMHASNDPPLAPPLDNVNQPPTANGDKKPETQPRYETKLFTGMLKREAGYNPECGDWEFFVVSGDTQKLFARGKIDSCIACHQGYKATDYVTRTYMPAK